MSATLAPSTEQRETFECFGSQCTVIVADALAHEAAAAVFVARRRLLEWHDQFSRFTPDSELARLNDDPAETVAVSPIMRRVVEAAIRAAEATGGLVDPTLLDQIERAGYDAHFDQPGLPLLDAARAGAGAPSGPTVAAGELAARADGPPHKLGDPPAGGADRSGRNRQGRVRR